MSGAVERWLASLPGEATVELVRPGFYFVRLPGQARRTIPIEIEVGRRSVKLTSHVIVEPDEAHAEVYAFLLRRNHEARGAAFSIDGREGVICLVARLGLDGLDAEAVDAAAGRIVEATEESFRTILELGFARRLARPGQAPARGPVSPPAS